MLHIREARCPSLILYKISHFLTFDLDFDLFGPTFFLSTKLLSTHRGSINKIGWSEFKCVGGRVPSHPGLRLIIAVLKTSATEQVLPTSGQ